ncbi:MAG: GNAT family N-acetyltransferase [Pseudomonadota bacterium]
MQADALAALHEAAFGDPRAHGWGREEFARALSDPLYVVQQSEDAYALARVLADSAELILIATRPNARRRGAARAALHALEAALLAKGATTLFAEVESTNTAALALYGSEGFSETGLRRGYYGPERDAITLEKPLKS